MHRIALLFDIKHPHKIYFKTIYNFSQPVVEMFFFFKLSFWYFFPKAYV